MDATLLRFDAPGAIHALGACGSKLSVSSMFALLPQRLFQFPPTVTLPRPWEDGSDHHLCVRRNRNIRCHYSYMSKLGKPKGSLNKKTIERLQQFMATETLEQSRGQPQQKHQQQQAYRRPQQYRRHHERRSPTLSSSKPRTSHVASADVGTTSLIGNEPVSMPSATGNITTVAPIETQITAHSVLENPPIPSPVSATTTSRHDASLPKPPTPHGEVASIHRLPDHDLVDSTSNETETAGDLLSSMLLSSNNGVFMDPEPLMAEDWSPSMTDYLDMVCGIIFSSP